MKKLKLILGLLLALNFLHGQKVVIDTDSILTTNTDALVSAVMNQDRTWDGADERYAQYSKDFESKYWDGGKGLIAGHNEIQGRPSFGYSTYNFWNARGKFPKKRDNGTWSSGYPHHDFREYLTRLEQAGGIKFFTLPYGRSKQLQDQAATMASYANNPTDQLRIQDGRTRVWGVDVWNIGREVPWDQVANHESNPETYGFYAGQMIQKVLEVPGNEAARFGIMVTINGNWLGQGWPNTERNGRMKNLDEVFKGLYRSGLFDNYPNVKLNINYHHYAPPWPNGQSDLQQRAFGQFQEWRILNRVEPNIERIENQYSLKPIQISNQEYFWHKYDIGPNDDWNNALYIIDNQILSLKSERHTSCGQFNFSHKLNGTMAGDFFWRTTDTASKTFLYEAMKRQQKSLGRLVLDAKTYEVKAAPVTWEANASQFGPDPLEYEQLNQVWTYRPEDSTVVGIIINRWETPTILSVELDGVKSSKILGLKSKGGYKSKEAVSFVGELDSDGSIKIPPISHLIAEIKLSESTYIEPIEPIEPIDTVSTVIDTVYIPVIDTVFIPIASRAVDSISVKVETIEQVIKKAYYDDGTIKSDTTRKTLMLKEY